VRETRPLVETLSRTNAARSIAAAGALAFELGRDQRLVSLVDRSHRLLTDFEQTDILSRTPEALDELLRIQRETLAVQRETIAIQREALKVQQQTLVHARNVDRKTGPPPPVASGG
jgi:hypothetical protein